MIGRAGAALALGCLLVPAQAQFAPDASLGKPTPTEGKIEAVKGETMTINLVSEAKTRASVVEFLIRDFPLNGELGPMVSVENDRTKATIKYTPFNDTAATTDSFTYAVRYPGGLWSQKAEVEIKLLASEPKIHATAEVDFGEVMIGNSIEKEIFLSNSGNAPYRNQIQLPPPWAIVEPAKGLLNLPIGGQQVVKVRFTPDREGPQQFQVTFFRNQGATSQLKGAGFSPFVIDTPEVALRWSEKNQTRVGTIRITSNAAERMPVALTTDERLLVGGGGASYLQPGKATEFEVVLPSTDSAAYAGQVQVASGAYMLPIQVSAEIAPPFLVVENTGTGEGRLDFGAIEAGALSQGSFQLRNAGGSKVKVKLETQPPFSVLAAGGVATLDPQESEAFAVRVTAAPGLAGLYEGVLWIEGENGQSLKVPMRAVFLGADEDPAAAALRMQASAPGIDPADRPPGATSSVPGSDRPPTAPGQRMSDEEVDRAIAEMDAMRSPLGFITMPLVEREFGDTIPRVPDDAIRLLEDGRRFLSVGWNLPGIGYEDFEIEMRMTRQIDDNHVPESVWVPYHDVEYQVTRDGQMAASIRGLAPNTRYEFRLFTLGDNGKVSNPLAFVAKTRMPLDWTWIYVGFGVFVLGGIGTFIWWRLKNSTTPSFSLPGLDRARDLIRGTH